MSLFSTPSPPSEAGGTGPAGGRPDFPSPTKLVRNGLTGTELGAQMAAENLLKLSQQRSVTYSGKREEVVTFDCVIKNKIVTAFGDVAERLLHLNGKDGYSFSEWTNYMCDKKEMPPNDQVKNYIGKPIPEKLYSQLVATHQLLQQKKGGETLMLKDVWGGLTDSGGKGYRGSSIW